MSLLAACSVTKTPENVPISHIDETSGYRRIDLERLENLGDTVVLLSFSGGGTRAAALSYGVLE
jgi:NTE family protein